MTKVKKVNVGFSGSDVRIIVFVVLIIASLVGWGLWSYHWNKAKEAMVRVEVTTEIVSDNLRPFVSNIGRTTCIWFNNKNNKNCTTWTITNYPEHHWASEFRFIDKNCLADWCSQFDGVTGVLPSISQQLNSDPREKVVITSDFCTLHAGEFRLIKETHRLVLNRDAVK